MNRGPGELSLGLRLLDFSMGLLARLVDVDPAVDSECGGTYCKWCERGDSRAGWREPWIITHDESCAWVAAQWFLGRKLPSGHTVA